jgi:hypothetical protein
MNWQKNTANVVPSGMMEAARTSETSVDNHFTRQYIPEDSSEHHTRRRENFKSHSKRCPSTNGVKVCGSLVASVV